MTHRIAPFLALAFAGAAVAADTNAPFDDALAANLSGRVVAPHPVVEATPSSDLWRTPWLAMCFAPGTSDDYMEQMYFWVLANSSGENGERYFPGGSWNGDGINSVGTPTSRTYSFPSDTLGGIGGGASTQNVLNQRFVQWFGSVNEGQDKVRAVFDRWQTLAAVTYTQINDDNASWGTSGNPSRGDIRIVSINIDGPGGTLAFNFFPTNGDMVIDSSESYQSSGNNFRFFRNVVAHENGHGMGLAHSCPQDGSKLMEPGLNTSFDGPRTDDVRGMQRIYGDNAEPNDTAGLATNLGQLGLNLILNDRSIDNGAGNAFHEDIDFYRVTLPTSGLLNAYLRVSNFPNYPNAPQGGGCPSGPLVQSSSILNLGFQIIAPDGVTVLHTANANGAGVDESVADFEIETGGNYYLRVFTTSSALDIQLYRFELSFVGAGCQGDTNGDNMVNFVDLNNVLTDYNQSGAFLPGDVNDDGTCNFDDLNIVLSNYNEVC